MSTVSFATQLAVTMHPTQVSETRKSSPVALAQKPAARTNTVVDRGQALQEVYDKHVEQIYKFVYFKVGNREDAEDITSQIFIKAANSMDLTQENQVKLAWLYQVARTTITDHWRNYYKAPSSSLDEMEEASPLHLAADPIYLTNSDEEVSPAVEKVQSLLEMLPANYRQVLQLRFLQGCTLKETALAMGITEGNAKVLQHRALQKAVKVGAVLV